MGERRRTKWTWAAGRGKRVGSPQNSTRPPWTKVRRTGLSTVCCWTLFGRGRQKEGGKHSFRADGKEFSRHSYRRAHTAYIYLSVVKCLNISYTFCCTSFFIHKKKNTSFSRLRLNLKMYFSLEKSSPLKEACIKSITRAFSESVLLLLLSFFR